jgi:hypothetical protein
LVPELQVVLAYLLEKNSHGPDPATIIVPENTANLIQNALGKHVRRKLEEAFIGEQLEARRRQLKTQALFVVRKLADLQRQRGPGIPTGELVSSFGRWSFGSLTFGVS